MFESLTIISFFGGYAKPRGCNHRHATPTPPAQATSRFFDLEISNDTIPWEAVKLQLGTSKHLIENGGFSFQSFYMLDIQNPKHLLKRYLDPKNIPITPSQAVFGCLGVVKLYRLFSHHGSVKKLPWISRKQSWNSRIFHSNHEIWAEEAAVSPKMNSL